MAKPIIAPSLLAANFSNTAAALADIDNSGAEWVHLDIMDGHFVPNISFGPKMTADLRPLTSLIFDVHLMISNPENYIAIFAQSGADYITVHAESTVHLHRVLTIIRDIGKKAGISIVPSTPVSIIEELLPIVDLVLVMTVNPGFGGQTIIIQCLEKVKTLVKIRKERDLSFLVSVDGGINASTAVQALEAGVDIMITGEAFFKSPDKKNFIEILKGKNL